MKKLFILILTILVCCAGFLLVSCKDKVPEFEDVEIIVTDLDGVKAGECVLRYTIKDFDEITAAYGATVQLFVSDEKSNDVPVSGNRITAENNKIYTVTVRLNSTDGRAKTAVFTVTTERTRQILTFRSTEGAFVPFTREVIFGEALTEIPAVPDYSKPEDEKATYTTTSKSWSKTDFSKITSDETVYAVYEFSSVPKAYNVRYDVDGGTALTPTRYNYSAHVDAFPSAIKQNEVFFSWFFDEAYTKRVTSFTITEDVTLYAKFVHPVGSDASYFEFSHSTVSNGYSICAKNGVTLPSEVVIPNVYEGRCVTEIANNAFLGHTEITSVTIPETILLIGYGAFAAIGAAETPMNLVSVTVETTQIRYVPYRCFYGNTSLSEISLPSLVEYFGIEAFAKCTMLERVHLPTDSRLWKIQASAFENCTSLSRFDFYYNEEYAEETYAHYYDENLGKYATELPSIAEKAFYNCVSLNTFVSTSKIPPAIIDASAFKRSGTDGDVNLDELTFYVPKIEVYVYYYGTRYTNLFHTIEELS